MCVRPRWRQTLRVSHDHGCPPLPPPRLCSYGAFWMGLTWAITGASIPTSWDPTTGAALTHLYPAPLGSAGASMVMSFWGILVSAQQPHTRVVPVQGVLLLLPSA